MALREHSRVELARKLGQRGYSVEYVELLLDQLAEQGLQSDARFTEQYVAQRRAKGYGPLRIRSELDERGIDRQLSENALAESGDWQEQLQAVAARRFDRPGEGDRNELAKQVRFLSQRGFPEAMVRRLFSRFWDL